jgi:transcriptional regulator with XRE-family HTH domain
LCDPSDPGTREGVILVVAVPPKSSGKSAGAAETLAREAGVAEVEDGFPRGEGELLALDGVAPHDEDQPADGQPAVKRRASGDERRRDELADFLRNRRASLKPADVGLPEGGRRRTPGLRREEVAQLAGVGTTWYTWLEQGRDVRASLDVLEALARALRLVPAERTHLMLLGRGEEPPPCKLPAERVSPTLRRLIANLGANPAFLLGRRWDYLAWNPAAAALFGDLARVPRGSRNHAWLTFMDPRRRELLADWERGSRLLVAKFRADSARYLGDPQFEQLIGALRQSSPEFRRAWKRHEVSRGGEGRKELRHPEAGTLVFSHAVFHPAEAPEQRLILYSPLPDHDTPAKLARLLERADVGDRDAPVKAPPLEGEPGEPGAGNAAEAAQAVQAL